MVHGIIVPASDARDLQAVELAELEDYQSAVGGSKQSTSSASAARCI